MPDQLDALASIEELENIHDSTGAFEEDSEDKDEDVGDGAMEWRRNLLEEAAESGGDHAERIEGEVELQGVHLAYDGENDVLQDLNLRLARGETIAVVGATAGEPLLWVVGR